MILVPLQLQLFLGITLVVASLGFISESSRVHYDEYHVYNIVPERESQITFLKDIESTSDSIIFMDGIHSVNESIDVVVAPHKALDFEIVLNTTQIKFSLIEEDFERALRNFNAPLKFDVYNSLEDTNNWLLSLPEDYPAIVSIMKYGESYEGRDLNCLKISYNSTEEKDAIFVEAGMNGQEWIAPATALYLINELLTSSSLKVSQVAKSYDWYIIPHVNPDGYQYSRTVDRLWRKTRKPYGTSFGANLNRNFDYKWGEFGSSKKACATNYIGPQPESEIEAVKLHKLVFSLQKEIKLYVSLHAFGQRLEYPEKPRSDNLYEICRAAISALKVRYGTQYTCGSKFDSQFPESGTFTDWVYKEFSSFAQLAFSYKLRPKRRNYETGFQLHTDQIVPTAEETLDSLVAMINTAERFSYLNPDKLAVIPIKYPKPSSYPPIDPVPNKVPPTKTPTTKPPPPTKPSTKWPIHDELF